MPFTKSNIRDEIRQKVKNDKEFSVAYSIIEKEYELIEKAIAYRKEKKVSQAAVAQETGLTQQMISNIEKLGKQPSLRNFLRYIDGLGLELRLEKKDKENRINLLST